MRPSSGAEARGSISNNTCSSPFEGANKGAIKVEEFSVGEVLMQQQQESFTEIGRKHLPEYRAHFEKLTRAVVEHHVANRLFREDNKRFAALAWLNELEETEKQKQI